MWKPPLVMHHRFMGLPRRFLWSILTAIPVLVISGWGLWILHDYFRIRDRLGTWKLTVSGSTGVVGTCAVDFRDTFWMTTWTAKPPFLAFHVGLESKAGSIRLDERGRAAMGTLGTAWAGGSYDLYQPSMRDGIVRVYWRPTGDEPVEVVGCNLFSEDADVICHDEERTLPAHLLRTAVER